MCFPDGVLTNSVGLLQVFVNARLHVSGGALGGGRMVEDASSVAGLCLAHLIAPCILLMLWNNLRKLLFCQYGLTP